MPFFLPMPFLVPVMSAPAPHAESSLRLASGLPAKGMMTTISFLINRVEEFTWLGGAFGQCRRALYEELVDSLAC